MKIVLINPPHPYLKQPRSQAPLGLLYVAAALEKLGHDVSVADYTATSWKDIKVPNADMYGITGTLIDVDSINRVIALVKDTSSSPVVVGGPCAEVSECIVGADSIVFGEGELIIEKVVREINNLSGEYHASAIKDLDALPYPARHLLTYHGGNIFANNKMYKGRYSTVITSSRGCPHNCAFCSSPSIWGSARFRSAESVAAEAGHIVNRYKIHQLRFSDDSFTAIPNRAVKIAELLKPLDVFWRVSIRVKPNGVEMFRAMYEGGCREVSFGIESFDQHVLDTLNKNTTVDDNIAAIKNAKKAGMVVRALLMVGTPGQRPDTIEKNTSVIDTLDGRIDSVSCTTFMPLPGSAIWRSPEKYGIQIVDTDYTNYNFYMFDKSGKRDTPMVITHINRDDKDVIEENATFRQYLINKRIANVG